MMPTPMKSQLVVDGELAKELCALDHGLSDWEMTFADSLAKQTEAGRELSAKQRAVAKRILEGR